MLQADVGRRAYGLAPGRPSSAISMRRTGQKPSAQPCGGREQSSQLSEIRPHGAAYRYIDRLTRCGLLLASASLPAAVHEEAVHIVR